MEGFVLIERVAAVAAPCVAAVMEVPSQEDCLIFYKVHHHLQGNRKALWH